MTAQARFRLRIQRDGAVAIGPGKVDLLEAIDSAGSIAAAARARGMSYRRAWLLIDEMNRSLRQPVIEAKTGGAHGGGAQLTATAREVISRYRRVEQLARQAAAEELAALTALLRDADDVQD